MHKLAEHINQSKQESQLGQSGNDSTYKQAIHITQIPFLILNCASNLQSSELKLTSSHRPLQTSPNTHFKCTIRTREPKMKGQETYIVQFLADP